jgi:hypothetical protein
MAKSTPFCHHDFGWQGESHHLKVVLELPLRLRQKRQELDRTATTNQHGTIRLNPAYHACHDSRGNTCSAGKTCQAKQTARAKHPMGFTKHGPDVLMGQQIKYVV